MYGSVGKLTGGFQKIWKTKGVERMKRIREKNKHRSVLFIDVFLVKQEILKSGGESKGFAQNISSDAFLFHCDDKKVKA